MSYYQFQHLCGRLDVITGELQTLKQMIRVVIRKESHMAGELDTLEADVAALTTVAQSAEALLAGLKAKLDAAIASGDMSRVSAVSASIEANTSALAAAVSANTAG